MRKCLFDNRLRSVRTHAKARAGFSLAELVVSIGILILMLSLAGQVFTTTSKSTGQATSLTEVHQQLRAVEQAIREDLSHVLPGQSLLLIQSNPVNAYWTADGKAADPNNDPSDGYPHVADPVRERADGSMELPRADILMFFTARKDSSFTDPTIPPALVQQVVYGHATLGEYVPDPDQPGTCRYRFEPNLPEDNPMFPVDGNPPYPSVEGVAPVPASQWHLARRGVLLMPNDPPEDDPKWIRADRVLLEADENNEDPMLADERILQGATDVIWNFYYEGWVIEPGKRGEVSDTTEWSEPEIFNQGIIGEQAPYARSQLDPTPPAACAERLGHYLLPNCASFKVEWTLDPHSEFVGGRLAGQKQVFWFDQGRYKPNGEPKDMDPLWSIQAVLEGSDPTDIDLDYLLNSRTNHGDGLGEYLFAERFRGRQLQQDLSNSLGSAVAGDDLWPVFGDSQRRHDPRPNLVLFGAHRRKPSPPTRPNYVGDIVDEDIFPAALRITIDVSDRDGRLEKPVRHVMIVPLG
ncbi:MAG: type II secretion system protein [Phycisphaerae bacterium]|jgi:type II secretory pathway pseudopilin PulG